MFILDSMLPLLKCKLLEMLKAAAPSKSTPPSIEIAERVHVHNDDDAASCWLLTVEVMEGGVY